MLAKLKSYGLGWGLGGWGLGGLGHELRAIPRPLFRKLAMGTSPKTLAAHFQSAALRTQLQRRVRSLHSVIFIIVFPSEIPARGCVPDRAPLGCVADLVKNNSFSKIWATLRPKVAPHQRPS